MNNPQQSAQLSEDQMFAAVFCRGDSVEGQQPCGQVPLSESEYSRQLRQAHRHWMCPRCGSTADFDDDHFESKHYPDEGDDDEPAF